MLWSASGRITLCSLSCCGTWSVTPLEWESHKPSDPETDRAAGKGRTSFFAFCATVREWLCFLEPTSKQTKNNYRNSVLLLISFSGMPMLLGRCLCSFPPHILQFYQEDSVRMQTWEKIPTRSSHHCGGKRNESCVLSNPQQLGLLGINFFPIAAFWNPGMLHPARSYDVQLN